MKSFLCQGKTISDAIQKAMKESGNPETFNIKIVDRGNQSIFWWLSKEAIIIFSYEDVPVKQHNTPVKSYKKNLYHHKNHSFHDEPSVTSNLKSQKKVFDGKDKKIDIGKGGDFNYENNNEVQTRTHHGAGQSYGMHRTSRVVKKTSKSDIQKFDMQDVSKERKHVQSSPHGHSIKYENSENDSRKQIKKIENLTTLTDNKQPAINDNKNKKHIIQKEHHSNNNVVADKNNPLSVDSINYLLWTDDRITFVKDWINKLNEYMHFALEGVDYKIDNNKLIIKINKLHGDIERDKKYFYSSIVLLLYQSFQNKFVMNDIQENDFKIVIE